MAFLNYHAVHVALFPAFSRHHLPFFRPISLLTEPRPTCLLSHVFRSSPLVNQGKSSALEADVTENELVCLTFLFYVQRELDMTKGGTYPSPKPRQQYKKISITVGKKTLGWPKGMLVTIK